MKYISTRGGDIAPSFEAAVMAGLAKDGGLFVPETFPEFSEADILRFATLSYPDLAYEIIAPFVDGDIPENDLRKILLETYNAKNFGSNNVAPIKDLGQGQYILELFHGPTLAFKDFALQFLGRVFDYFLARSHRKLNILGATSGDTGSAAIYGCMGRENINIFILHPNKRVSEVQRKQMTSITAANVFNIAVEGSFDDCQNIVKSLFEDLEFKEEYNLSAVNSINWGRIVAQIVYYFWAVFRVDQLVSFSVPTGNFGNILAGYYATKMGLPVEKFIIATNKNDILHRFMRTGVYKMEEVYPTLSPSMDIQISSNFERFLADFLSPKEIAEKINDLKTKGEFKVEKEILRAMQQVFESSAADDEAIKWQIEQLYSNHNEVVDPHTATGVFASHGHEPVVTMATAHPAKFPEAVKIACGAGAELPEALSDLLSRKEKMVIKQNDSAEIKDFIINSQ